MEVIRFTDLECHYGAREIFSGLDGVLNDGERIALVGSNGAGKSSLLRLLAGVDERMAGTIVRARDVRQAYLAQGAADESASTLNDLVEAALARAADANWALKNKMLRTMLTAFGFGADDYTRPLREFSGGQRAKAALAHVLIDDPELLILDEPTNHLDIDTVRWLESFIAADKRTYILVSHDRYFIDRVATRVWEIDRGRFFMYPARAPAYTNYVVARDMRLEEERRAHEQFVTERDKRRSTIAGLRATKTSSDYSQVRSREKHLKRLEAEAGGPPPAPEARPINVRLRASRRAANGFAFEARGLAKSYGRALFSDLSVDVAQGERLAIVGPNGAGKSTLLKILAGEVAADAGSIRFNPAARSAYFAQNAHDQLDVEKTAVESVLAMAPVTAESARALLGRMRISGEAADKPVRAFSGGERRRIMLACLMARQADVLLLDEPTNDLDIDSREALEIVLDEYEGAIVLVSHDRYLLSRLCDRVVWIDGGRSGILEGGYDAYESAQRRFDRDGRESSRAQDRTKASRQTPLKQLAQLRTQLASVEREIAKLESRKAAIEALFEDPRLYQDRERVRQLQVELAGIGEQSGRALSTWGSLGERLERLEGDPALQPQDTI
ncbi:MAG: ABC-F family ATP-binding cassette domain-containing protein [Candidatus Eremiobacteraeota bacterium]|nr:ABC-F family ATP-binding cassette domain-containing protein [Candidatus Eremiobacteraeota bacterium]